MNESAPGTTGQDSRTPRGSRVAVPWIDVAIMALAVAAFLGPALLVVSDFLTLFEVQTEAGVAVPDGVVKGRENHSFAMVLLGVAALPMAYGAVSGGSRPAMAGLAFLGAIAIVVALAFDLPDATGTHTLARTFENATGHPKLGFYLETLGAVLAIVAGVGSLILTAPARGRGDGRRRRSPGAVEEA